MDYGLGENIYSALNGSTAITGIVSSRIYEDEAPEGTVLPYIVWGLRNFRQIDSARISEQEAEIVVDLYLDTKGSTLHWSALAGPVRTALHDKGYSLDSGNAVATVRFSGGTAQRDGGTFYVAQLYDVKLRNKEST